MGRIANGAVYQDRGRARVTAVAGLDNLLYNLISHWYLTAGYIGIVLAMAVESCCVPLPSEIVMPLAGFYVVQYPQHFSLIGVGIAGAVGCLIGSAAAYWIGRSGGRPLILRYGRYILISQADSDRADRLFARYGGAVTFFSRLLPVVRTYISLPAGIAEMGFMRFSVYTLLGSLPWCFTLAWVGSKVGERSNTLGSVFRGLDVVMLALVMVGVALYVWRHIQHDRAARDRRASAGARSNRPRLLPSIPFDTPDRPTVPDIQSVPAWPNRYARPVQTTPLSPARGRTAEGAARTTGNRPVESDGTPSDVEPSGAPGTTQNGRNGPAVRRRRWR
jgi:membrane protein DedA with SNARE-associated domain